MHKVLLVSSFITLLSGCIFVPKDVTYFNEQCQTFNKKSVLDTSTSVALQSCDDSTCALMLASAGLVSAASLVVSGSIVVVKNVVYWKENKSDCKAQEQNTQDKQPENNHQQGKHPELSDIERGLVNKKA
ncbi:hypothetical protein HG263_05130 [Pseudoalteromonas sp. JBTF-M23]|uniref:Lipoprotein n=1 Tax=Pseudoalteromonas caenipelagi TaxID=2726988 RepID=A0A849V8N0_9GAMM|nr:hypothetical protein [Pseudoalteromonas caenipelagi]NOU49919.1 hypothetical protein [Pseudoalteromonas caenipelagi]